VDSCEGGLFVEFCDSTAAAQGDDGYLSPLNLYVVRPIGSFFNFKTEENPNADIDVSDPLNAGYFERVTTWWGNYEDWEEQPALSFIMYIPLLLLLIVLPLLQVVASLAIAAFHFISMILKLLCLPVLVGLGFHSSLFISFCNVVKYATGAFCIFSDALSGVHFHKKQSGCDDLSGYSSDCRGINNLPALHATAHEIQAIPGRFKIAFFVTGAVFYPLRAVMLTLTSLFICSIGCIGYLLGALFSFVVAVCFFLCCTAAFAATLSLLS
jgi:hypothetical protein